MNNNNTLQELLQRASEQTILHDIPFPRVFLLVSRVFGINPWKILIPIAFLLVLLLHVGMGSRFDNAILWLFGGL